MRIGTDFDIICQLCDQLIFLAHIEFCRLKVRLQQRVLVGHVIPLLFKMDCFRIQFFLLESVDIVRHILLSLSIGACHTLREPGQMSWLTGSRLGTLTDLTESSRMVVTRDRIG